MKRRSFLAGAGAALAVPGGVLAQAPSGRPIRVVVPLPAGTSLDFVTRVMMTHVSTTLGQPVVVENKAGGSGIIGTMDVVKAPPDGHTLLLGSLSALSINVALVKNLPYDPRRDLTPIAGASMTNHVLVVKTNFPAQTFPEFIAYVKKNPGKVSVGYSTASVQVQIATMNKMAGIDLLPVPYKGTPATITDVIGGTLSATLLDPGNALAQVKGGHMRALSVSCLKRNPLTPDWPAVSETLPGYDFSAWNALAGPPGMPREAVLRINAAVNGALRQKDVIDKYAQSATVPLIMSADELKTYIDAETTKWIRLAREANIQPETI